MSNHSEQCSVNFGAARRGASVLLSLPLSLSADLLAITSSPNRFFQIHFKNIHIRLGPNIKPVFTGGFLRMIRKLAPAFALFVAPFFCLHCAKPTASHRADFGTTEAELDVELGRRRGFSETGYASWYGGRKDGFCYKRTANGEIMHPDARTCAHPFLPFGTVVRVENLSSGQTTVLRVNDRGPYAKGRIIDITRYAAEEIGILTQGVSKVRVRVIQDLVRTTKIVVKNKIKTPFPQANSTPTVKNIDTSAIFALLSGLAGKRGANISRSAWTNSGAAVQDIKEIANRLKNRRPDPFINRVR
jgi:rare lipoprotein A